jgi:hypothetical protein
MGLETDTVASGNELAAYFRQRQAAEDGGRWYGGSGYEGGFDQWITWPDWLNPCCQDRYSALDAGRCCRDSRSTVIRLALNLADMGQEMLDMLDRGKHGERDCVSAAADFSPLVDTVPQFVAAIKEAVTGAERPLAVQLGCALDRVSLFVGRLAKPGRCPWRCGTHGHPDRGPELALLRAQLDECSGVIWDALHPRSTASESEEGERVAVRM